MFVREVVVPVTQPFELNLSLAFLRGFSPMMGEQKIGRDTLIKSWLVRKQPITVTMKQARRGLSCRLESSQRILDDALDVVRRRVSSFSSAKDNLEAFYDIAARDKAFAPVARRLRGFHHPKFATPFEAACWGVINQRIQLAQARKMKEAIVHRWGAKGCDAFPEASTLADATLRDLTRVLGHERKARPVWAVSQAFAKVDEKWLETAPLGDVEAWLHRIYGVGDFTAAFVLYRGLGRTRSLPWSDRFVIAACKTYGRGCTRKDLEKIGRGYGPWLGLWSLYLWAATFVDGKTQRFYRDGRTPMPTFKLDGKELPFTPGQTIITAAWKQGVEIPHYCWHPGLSVAANCRMCLVEIMPPPNQKAVMLDILEWDAEAKTYKPQRKPKLQPACQIAITEGMDVRSDSSDHVKKARKDVQEFLLLQHPVDCPICDQAGECKLQDYWLEHGGYHKRMRDEPVHKPKGVSFGDTIVYDAERCVVCTRCVRFMAEVAKDPVLDQRERGNIKEIIVSPGRKLEGNYTFMTEHVCPVGALTTKDFRFKARVWFLRGAKSICQGCATGCNAWLDFDPRYNKVERYRPRDNEAVNKFWMCDSGMMSYLAAHEGRVVDARVSGKAASTGKAIEAVKKSLDGVPQSSVAIVLSAQASLEDNWALAELARLMGATSFFLARAPDGNKDDILIHADKNSNTQGAKLVAEGAKSWVDFLAGVESGAIRHAIALGALTGDLAIERDKLSKLEVLVTIASHESALTAAAKVVLPATSWAEHDATYVNAKGLKQRSDKAINPQGSSRQALLHLADVARALGLEPTWAKLKDVRVKLGLEESKEPGVLPTTATQAL